MKNPASIPFSFVVEELHRASPKLKPMFGCHAIYVKDKIVLILRKKKDSDPDNGVWIATAQEHHQSLHRDFPSMRSIKLFGKSESNWQMLPCDSDDFEESAIKACELILKNDNRIGRIPKSKKRSM